jgi:hypothetical protein
MIISWQFLGCKWIDLCPVTKGAGSSLDQYSCRDDSGKPLVDWLGGDTELLKAVQTNGREVSEQWRKISAEGEKARKI